METNKVKTKLPNLAVYSNAISHDNERVTDFVDGLVEYVDEMIDATSRSDWSEVKKLAEYIAVSSLTFGVSNVADAAERVSSAACDLDNDIEIKRRVMRMVGEYGRIRSSQDNS